MKAVSGSIPHGEDWCFELKWDGMRIQAGLDGADTTLRSGSGRTVTSCFPELGGLSSAMGINAVLDGEIVVFDGERPSFSRLQRRIHVEGPPVRLLEDEPVVYLIFDLLALDGQDTTSLPYLDRRRLLADLVDQDSRWYVPPHVEGDGTNLLEFAKERDLEGIVAKRSQSPYQSGSRSHHWIKIKIRKRQEFVIGGWLEGTGSLAGTVGSVLVGVYDNEGFVFAGAVGSGLTDRERTQLLEAFQTVEQCPFDTELNLGRTPVWVEPDVVVEVGFAEWEPGHHVRHPTYEGRRVDKLAREVYRDRTERLE